MAPIRMYRGNRVEAHDAESIRWQPPVWPAVGHPRSSSVIAPRVGDWAARHAIADDALLLNIRSVIKGALSDYFRFLTCDDSLMVFHHAPSASNAMLLILPADDRYWRVSVQNGIDASDVTRVTFGQLLDNARNLPHLQDRGVVSGWIHTREDLPLNAFIRSELQVPFSERLMECFARCLLCRDGACTGDSAASGISRGLRRSACDSPPFCNRAHRRQVRPR